MAIQWIRCCKRFAPYCVGYQYDTTIPSGPGSYDDAYATCVAAGGLPKQNAFPQFDPCPDDGLSDPCGGIGRCFDFTLADPCQITDVCNQTVEAECWWRNGQRVDLQGAPSCYDWLRDGLCPVKNQYELKMFPFLRRIFPHRIGFSVAPVGSAPFGVEENCLTPGCQPPTFPSTCPIGRSIYFQSARQCCDPRLGEQIGFLRLSHKLVCQDPTTLIVTPMPVGSTICDPPLMTRWDSRAYMAPAIYTYLDRRVGQASCGAPPDPEPKFQPIIADGFWRPDHAIHAARCLDPVTFAELLLPGGGQITSQADCELQNGLWRTDTIVRPPSWHGILRTTGSNFPPHININYLHAIACDDTPGASEYDYMLLMPVEPLAAFGPTCCTGAPCVPYCSVPNAPSMFPVRDTRTIEILCRTRDYLGPNGVTSGRPYVNRSFGVCRNTQTQELIPTALNIWQCEAMGATWDTGPPNVPAGFVPDRGTNVPGGLVGIIAHSTTASNADLHTYCSTTCPPHADCVFPNCKDVGENILRRHSGVSAPKRFEWDTDPVNPDPLKRGLWIDYLTEIKSIFTEDGNWQGLVSGFFPVGSGLRCVRPNPRWNAWYSGKTIATWPDGAEQIPEFVAWVLTHDSGFGLDFQPRYDGGCNDVLAQYANEGRALGDTTYPPQSLQTQCAGQQPAGGPCLNLFGKLSKWYLYGDTPITPGVPSPTLPRSAPAPHDGLYHETVRTRYLAPRDAGVYAVEYGWAKLLFVTGPPQFLEPPPP